jgi:hypothetical protein
VSAKASSLPVGFRSALRSLDPLAPRSPESLLERGSTFLPYEREMRDRYVAWETARRATEFRAVVREDLCTTLWEVPASPGLSKALGRRRLYRSAPLPGRPLEGPWVVFEEKEARPLEGRAYRIHHPVRVPIAWRDPTEPWGVEEVLWTAAPEPAREGDLFPRPCLGARAAAAQLKEFGEATGLPAAVSGSLLLPFVGAPPWHARTPGLNLAAGAWVDIPSRLLAGIEAPLRQLLPPWEAVARRRAGGGRGSAHRAADGIPYVVELARTGATAWERLRSPGRSLEISHLVYGAFGQDQLGDVLFEAHLPVMASLDSWMAASDARLDVETAATLADHLVRSHFLDPEPLEPDPLHAAVDQALDRIREALRQVPAFLNLPSEEYSSFLSRTWGKRDHVVQAALSHARMLGRSQLSAQDVRAIADQFVDSINVLDVGTSAATRELLSHGERVVSRKEFARLFLLRSVLMDQPDRSEEELWERLRRKGSWKGREEFSTWFLQFAAQGGVAEARPGRYRWGGL